MRMCSYVYCIDSVMCIYAQMEAKVILSRLLQTFRVSLPPDYKFVVAGRFTLQPKDAVPCTLETKL